MMGHPKDIVYHVAWLDGRSPTGSDTDPVYAYRQL